MIKSHGISKKNIILRPNATRRVSFRGTPGGSVSVRLFAKRGPNLDIAQDSIDGGVGDYSSEFQIARNIKLNNIKEASKHRVSREDLIDSGDVEKVVAAHVMANPDNGINEIGTAHLNNNPNKISNFSFEGNDYLFVDTDPRDPILPTDMQSPMQVRFRVRDGATFHDEVTQPNPDGHPGQPTVNSNHQFISHDIIDVLFTNHNEYPVIFSAGIEVKNELTVTTTTLPSDLIQRIMKDALLLLSPIFGINKGKLIFGLEKDVGNHLKIEKIKMDLEEEIDVHVDIKPVKFELLSNEELIRTMALEVEAEIKKLADYFYPFESGNSKPESVPPSDLVHQIVETFFSDRELPDYFETTGLDTRLWGAPLFNRPLLTGGNEDGAIEFYKKGKRDDLALKYSLRVTDIFLGTSRFEFNIDTITADFYITLRNGRTYVSHPNPELFEDKIPTGQLYPRFQLNVDVSKIEVEVDFHNEFDPDGENVVTRFSEFVAEKISEWLLSYFKSDFENNVVELGMNFLNQNVLGIGEFASSIMNEIVNRDHLFLNLSTNSNTDLVIQTLDPSQLSTPFEAIDDTDHRFDDIEIQENPVHPIDGQMPFNSNILLNKTTNLVFLMMENRSFDHMLGYLSHPNHGNRDDVDGLDGLPVRVGGIFEDTIATPQPSPRLRFSPNPGHHAETVVAQINDGAMDGFASEFERRIQSDEEINRFGNQNDAFRILDFYTSNQLKEYDELSKTSMILDKWFCSIPGGTYPNRSCYYSGVAPYLENKLFSPPGYLPHLTLFDMMDHMGVDWRVYESSVSFLRMFKSYRLENSKIRPIEELTGSIRPTLPKVTFIDPDFKGSTGSLNANDDHAPTDVTRGQDLINEVIGALKRSSAWETTLFVIIYDEHGGFSDHVPPPGTSASEFPPDVDGHPSVPVAHPDASSYGVRIPAIVVSPLVKSGSVGHKIYDHATVYKTISERFMPEIRNSKTIPLRVRRARHLGELISDGEVALNPDRTILGFTAHAALDENRGVTELDHNVLANPDHEFDPRSSGKRLPDAIIRNDTDPVRPHFASIDPEDFHQFLTHLGNPLINGK